VRLFLGALLITALALPASAQAAPLVTVDLARESVRYGAAHRVDGTLTDGTTPLADQEVVLEGLRYPYDGSYRIIDRVTTNDEGEFRFDAELDRNHRLHVVAPAQKVQSVRLQAYTLPGFELSFRAISPGVVRLYQRYTVPKQVRLRSPTLFYLGKRGAKSAAIRRTGKLKRLRAGRYTSQVTVTLPSSWNGAFRYASCFRASSRSGMGDPDQSCPKLRLRF
jgi:hypothetical protein